MRMVRNALPPSQSRAMKIYLLLVLLLISGCTAIRKSEHSSLQPNQRTASEVSDKRFWLPTPLERARAEQVARAYALQQIGLKPDQLAAMKMEPNPIGSHKDGKRELLCQFYDPEFIQLNPLGFIDMRLGGFPDYLWVTVDVGA